MVRVSIIGTECITLLVARRIRQSCAGIYKMIRVGKNLLPEQTPVPEMAFTTKCRYLPTAADPLVGKKAAVAAVW